MGRKHWQQWYFYLVVTIALVSLGLLLGQSLLPQGPTAMAGVLDLREHLKVDEVVRLNGAWEFYFGQLLWPADFPAAEGLGSLQRVPGAWPDYYDVVPKGSTEFTAATYRLRVLVPEHTTRFGLKTTSIHANARIFVNGEEVLLSGKPGLTRASSELHYQPTIGVFEATGPELEIIVQASSKVGVTSGITQPLFFGSEAAIKRYQLLHVMRDTGSAIAMIMICIYLLVTSLRTNNRRAHLLAAAFSLFTGLKALTQSELLILQLFPQIPYAAFIRLGGIIILVQLYLLLKYVHCVYNVAPLLGKLQRVDVATGLVLVLFTGMLFLAPHYLEMFFLTLNGLAVLSIFRVFYTYRRPTQVGAPLLTAAIFCMVAVVISNVFTLVHEPSVWTLLLEMLLLLTLTLYGTVEHEHTYAYALQLNKQLTLANRVLLAKETAFLQAQIKPHFLFNALNTVISFCYTDPNFAGELLTELSVFLRHSVDFESTVPFVTIGHELRLVEAYVALEQARFGDKLTVALNINPHCLPYSIPPLTIQPLVENAIRHGLNRKMAEGTVQLEVVYQEANNSIQVTVTDNGVGIGESEMTRLMQNGIASRGVGLENINSRLSNLVGSNLWIKSETGRGTRVTFCLPALKQEEGQ